MPLDKESTPKILDQLGAQVVELGVEGMLVRKPVPKKVRGGKKLKTI